MLSSLCSPFVLTQLPTPTSTTNCGLKRTLPTTAVRKNSANTLRWSSFPSQQNFGSLHDGVRSGRTTMRVPRAGNPCA
eukprot:2674020-Pyramimonas_sp.AAC.4